MLKSILQGKIFGHPLHTILVHLPIGLFILSFLMDVATFFENAALPYQRISFYALCAGVVMGLVAAVPGLADYSDIRRDHPAKRTATWHMILNVSAVVLYAISVYLRWHQRDVTRVPPLPFVISLAALALVSVSGYLGGVLIYDQGIAVGRHRRRAPTPTDTLCFVGAPGAFIKVADVAQLGDRQTLRADINGVVIAIANLDGQFFAFQEFCTHRFGPLSEGCLADGMIECPWHRSRFDVKTGKVVHGPAKADLRCFDIKLEKGELLVRAPARPT